MQDLEYSMRSKVTSSAGNRITPCPNLLFFFLAPNDDGGGGGGGSGAGGFLIGSGVRFCSCRETLRDWRRRGSRFSAGLQQGDSPRAPQLMVSWRGSSPAVGASPFPFFYTV